MSVFDIIAKVISALFLAAFLFGVGYLITHDLGFALVTFMFLAPVLMAGLLSLAMNTLFPPMVKREIYPKVHEVGGPSPWRQLKDGTWIDRDTGKKVNIKVLNLSEFMKREK